MKVKTITAHILVDEQPLEEYKTEEEGNQVTCWVASEAGKSFAIVLEKDSGWSDGHISTHVFLNGQADPIDRYGCHEEDLKKEIKGVRISSEAMAKLEFKALRTTEEGFLDHLNVSESFGSIALVLRRSTEGKQQRWSGLKPQAEDQAYNEQLVKKRKISHVCGLGEATIPATTLRTLVTYRDPPDRPYCRFVFKYRSRSLLQAMDIIAASPPPASPIRNASAGPSRSRPSPEVVAISSDDDSEDETVKAAKAAYLQSKKDARAAKAARRASQADVKPKIEQADGSPVPKRAKFEPGEVIELSD